jgi:hypothetical protein
MSGKVLGATYLEIDGVAGEHAVFDPKIVPY